MDPLPAWLVTLEAAKQDPALDRGARGARKLVVTEIRSECEMIAQSAVWEPPERAGKCSVQRLANAEIAIFNQDAPQDRHWHEHATEIYCVIEGRMRLEAEGQDYLLTAGDMIVVGPGASHQVLPDSTLFLCRVIWIGRTGCYDKHVV